MYEKDEIIDKNCLIDNLRITNIPIQHQSKLLSLSFEFDVKENGFVEIKVWKNDEEYTDFEHEDAEST